MIRRMFKLAFFTAALAGGGLLALATTARESVEGSGTPATEQRDIGDVNEVALSGVGELIIVQGDVPSLRVSADDNVLPVLETETEGRKLVLHTKSRTSVNAKTPITYTLTAPRLETITISGAATVTSRRFESDKLAVKLSGAGKANLENLNCKSLNLSLSGAGIANLSGNTEKLTVKLSGAGGIDAKALKANSADVQISGAGNASIWATDTLKARVSGAGGVKYKGTPQLEQKVSGAGKIRPLE